MIIFLKFKFRLTFIFRVIPFPLQKNPLDDLYFLNKDCLCFLENGSCIAYLLGVDLNAIELCDAALEGVDGVLEPGLAVADHVDALLQHLVLLFDVVGVGLVLLHLLDALLLVLHLLDVAVVVAEDAFAGPRLDLYVACLLCLHFLFFSLFLFLKFLFFLIY